MTLSLITFTIPTLIAIKTSTMSLILMLLSITNLNLMTFNIDPCCDRLLTDPACLPHFGHRYLMSELYLFNIACFGILLIDPACLPCFSHRYLTKP